MKKRFSYWFDQKMASGSRALIIMLAGLVAVISVISAAIMFVLDSQSLADDPHPIMKAITLLIDSGSFADDVQDENAKFIYLLFVIVVTICGIFLSGTLIGIIDNAISAKLEDLKRGKSVVIANNHIVVLGWSVELATIIEQLLLESGGGSRRDILVMDNQEEKSEMDSYLRSAFPKVKNAKFITRSGSISDFESLKLCSIETSRCIIINSDSDDITIKSILAVTHILKSAGNTDTYIIAVLHEKANITAATIAGEGYVEILSYKDIASKIITHTTRTTGLSTVYETFFQYGGSEIYLEDCPEDAVGLAMFEINQSFSDGYVIGFQSGDGSFRINPPIMTMAKPGDRLIMIEDHAGAARFLSEPHDIDSALFKEDQIFERNDVEHITILGYNEKLPVILRELDFYLTSGSSILVAVDESHKDHLEELENIHLANCMLGITVTKLNSYENIVSLVKQGGRTILVLCDDNIEKTHDAADQIDAATLLLLLHLKQYEEENGTKLNVTSEMLRSDNRKLAYIADVNNFVVSESITSLMLAQIARLRGLNQIYDDLLSAEGTEIFIKPAFHYIRTDIPVDLYTAGAAVAMHREVLIGYKLMDTEDHSYSIVINPKKEEPVTFTDDDFFIVLAYNEE